MTKEFTKQDNPKYSLTLSMNNETFIGETEDLKEALQEFKSEDVHTEMYINIKKGQTNFDKRFTLIDAKKLFQDEEYLDLFINGYTSLYQ